MVNNVVTPPTPVNEPVLGYLPGSEERRLLKEELAKQDQELADAIEKALAKKKNK